MTDMPPPPPRNPTASALTVPMRQFSQKEDMKAWANAANAWSWFTTACKPMITGNSLQRTKLLLHGKATVTTKGHGILTDLADIDVQEFIPYRDEPHATDRMPTEHLEIFIVATITLISKGVASSACRARVAVLEHGLRSGLEVLRRHCIECRTQVRVRANFDMLVSQVNHDLNEWAARVCRGRGFPRSCLAGGDASLQPHCGWRSPRYAISAQVPVTTAEIGQDRRRAGVLLPMGVGNLPPTPPPTAVAARP